jgi:hypothetical protein
MKEVDNVAVYISHPVPCKIRNIRSFISPNAASLVDTHSATASSLGWIDLPA